MSNKTDKVTIRINRGPLSKGHQNHKSGAGTHGDRRLKRLKTRQTRFSAAIGD